MGVVVKVYLENYDQDIEILTLNSQDKKSSSVTITANFIKDYLNKLGRNEDLSGRRDKRIIDGRKNNEIFDDETRSAASSSSEVSVSRETIVDCESNSAVNEEQSRVCNSLLFHELRKAVEPGTPHNIVQYGGSLDDSEVISKSLGSSNRLVIEDENDLSTVEKQSSHEIATEVAHNVGSIPEGQIVCREDIEVNMLENVSVISVRDTAVTVADELTSNAEVDPGDAGITVDLAEVSASPNSDSVADPSNQSEVTENNNAPNINLNCNNKIISSSDTIPTNWDEKSSKSVEHFSNSEIQMITENGGVENVMQSLKNVSYDVDDFLTMVNIATPQRNQNSHSQLPNMPFFFGDFGCSPLSYADEKSDVEGDLLEEFFVIENVVASRFNEETKVLEFLLKAQRCIPQKYPWAPMVNTNINDFTITSPKCLYIKCPSICKPYRRRKLNEKLDQNIQIVDMEREFPFDVCPETTSSCPLINVEDVSPNVPFSSLNAADVVVDPQKSLIDACVIEPYTDDNKNITPAKPSKSSCENINTVVDSDLPPSHFYITDLDIGEQMVEFMDAKDSSATSTNSVAPSDVQNGKKPRSRKKIRNENKNETVKVYACTDCAYKTASSVCLENHIRRHNSEMLECGLCTKKFFSSGGLKNHQRVHRNGQKKSTCATTFPTAPATPSGCLTSSCDSSIDSSSLQPTTDAAVPLEAPLPPPSSSPSPTPYPLRINEIKKELSASSCCNRQPLAHPMPCGAVGFAAAAAAAVTDVKSNASVKRQIKNRRGRPKRLKSLPDVEDSIEEGCRVVGTGDNPRDDVRVAVAATITDARVAPSIASGCATAEAGGSPTCAPVFVRKKNSKPAALQKCLAEALDALEECDDEGTNRSSTAALDSSQNDGVQKRRKELCCDVCHESFKTKFDAFWHREQVHKYPIVLIKRLPM